MTGQTVDQSPDASSRAGKRRYGLVAAVVISGLVLGGVTWNLLPASPSRHFREAKRAFQQGDLDTVQTAAEALRGLADYEPHVHLLEGMVLLRQGRYRDAIIAFGHARDHEDTRALAYALSGEALYRSGHLRDARPVLERAVQLDPTQTDARRWLAATYFDIGAMNHAIDQLEVVAEQAPDDPQPHRMMGVIYQDYEMYAKAAAAYQESLRRDPNPPGKEALLLQLAQCLVHEHRHAEALDLLAQCPAGPEVWVLQAECRYGQAEPEWAKQLLAQTLSRQPDHLPALQLQAKIQLESDDVQEAVETLRQAVKRHPKDWLAHYQLARAYQRLGQEDQAKKEIAVMQPLRQLRERFTELHRQAMKDPADADIRFQLGLLAQQLDRPKLAVQWFVTTLAMDPEHEGARQALQEIRPAAGNAPIEK